MPTNINQSDQTITQYNIQTGGADNLLNNVAPSATSGIPVISQGSSAQPIFGTTVVAGGGTGVTSFANTSALLASGTTTTGALQNIASVATGQVLISSGTSTLPSYSAYPQISGLGIGASPGATPGLTFDGSNFLNNFVDVTSWTPILSFGGGTTGITYSSQNGRYCRIGNIVFIDINLALTNKGSSVGANSITIPIPTGSINNDYIQTVYLQFVTAPTTSYIAELNTNRIILGYMDTGISGVALFDTEFANNSTIVISGFYFIGSNG